MSYLLCRCTEYVSHTSLLSTVIYTCPVHPILHDLILLIFGGKDDHALQILVLGKAVPLHARSGLEDSRKLRFPDFVTTAQNGGRLSALGNGRLYPQEILLVLIYFRG